MNGPISAPSAGVRTPLAQAARTAEKASGTDGRDRLVGPGLGPTGQSIPPTVGMPRSAFVLVVLAFTALGLWIGNNPPVQLACSFALLAGFFIRDMSLWKGDPS